MDDFENFDSPLDLDNDGDDAIEMCLFFDEGGNGGQGKKQHQGSSCCVALLNLSSAVSVAIYGLAQIIT